MQYCNLASSSEGNVSYIREKSGAILLDCGKNLRYIENALTQIGTSAKNIDAIVISHEHADHVSALPKFVEVYKPRLYISMPSYLALAPQLSSVDESLITIIEGNSEFIEGDLRIRPYDVSHDAQRTYGFTIEGRAKMAFFTDLGYFDRALMPELKGIDLLVMESNYDEDMLLCGPYPPFLKQRIRSDKGHLSNKAAAEALAEIFSLHSPSYINLAHLSKHNNLPYLALRETEEALSEIGATEGVDYRLEAHSDSSVSPLLLL